jgi:mannose-1-phosphate guanylyltransferase
MNAFVLAAGFGTRLRPLTDTTPKPLVPVLNVPSVCYSLFLLKEAGFRKVIVNIHHHPDNLQRFFDNRDFGEMEIVLSEEKTILGTGGGLKKCESLLDDDHFLLINSDIISDIDLQALIARHRSNGLGGTLVLHETPLAGRIGAVGTRDGLVLDFRNMRGTGITSQFIYTGTAVLSPDIFRHLSEEFSSIVDTGFTGLIDSVGLGFYEHAGLWQDIGTLQNFYRANLDDNLRILQLGERMERSIGMAPHMVSPLAEISERSNVTRSVVGPGVSISPNATVEHSVLLPGSNAGPDSVIRNSIAGPGWILPI